MAGIFQRLLTSLNEEDSERLAYYLGFLPPLQSQIVSGFLSNQTQTEIAKSLGLSQPTISYHCRQMLKAFGELEKTYGTSKPSPASRGKHSGR